MNSRPSYSSGASRTTGTRSSSQKKSGGKKRVWQKIVLSVVLLVCVLLNGIYAVYNSFISQISFVEPASPEVSYTDLAVSDTDVDDSDNVPDGVVVSTDAVSIYLLIGSDSRFGLDAQSRSDSMIIMAVDRTHKKIKLISLMRDLLLKIPGKGYNRLNAAYASDSAKKDPALTLTRQTIADNFGINIDQFVVIDFKGFEKMIDMMGGVTVEVNAAEAKYMCSHKKYGLFPRYKAGAGTYNMNGAEALNYARIRKVGNGDFERTERQRKIIKLMMEKMRDQSYLQLAKMVKEGLGYVVTNVPQDQILGLAFEAPSLLKYDIVQYRVPVDGTFAFKSVMMGNSAASTIWANYKWNAAALSAFIFEDDMTYANSAKKAKVAIPNLPAAVKLAGEGAVLEDEDDDGAAQPTTTTEAAPQETTVETTAATTAADNSTEKKDAA